MASLEQSQGQHNIVITARGNTDASLDPNQTLIAGASALATGEALGVSKEDTLAALSRGRRKQSPGRMTNDEKRQAFQRFASIEAADGTAMPEELEAGTRSLRNQDVQLEQDGGERDQSVIADSYGRDTNRFTRWNDNTKSYEEVYIPDGTPTPDWARDQAIIGDMGARKVKTGQEEVVDRRGYAVTNQNGEVMMRNTYDLENNISETGAGQGWEGGAGKAASDAIQRVTGERSGGSRFSDAELAERLQRMYGDNIPTAIKEQVQERLMRTADPAIDKRAERREGAKSAIMDSLNYSGDAREANNATAEAEALRQMIGPNGDIEYIPGALTKANVDPERGVATRALRAESDARFNARPQAVINSEDSVAAVESLGEGSAYVDLATGEDVTQGVTPSRVQTNMPNSSQVLNAPVTTAASWVSANTTDNKGLLGETNMSQISADFSRRVEAAAPGYRSRPVRDVESFASQIQRVIDAKTEAGKNFYKPVLDENGGPVFNRRGRRAQEKVANPGIEDVMTALRMTSGEGSQLANALFSMQTASEPSRPVSSFSPGVNVTMGSMFGEKVDLGIAGRDTQRAAFARSEDSDAARPQIGAIRERDEFGKVTAEEPKPTRQVMKGRSPADAVITYEAQQRKNGKLPSRSRAREIYRGNASLRADQAQEEARLIQRRSDVRDGVGDVPARQIEDDAFFSTPNNKDRVAVRAPRNRGEQTKISGFNYDAQPKSEFSRRIEGMGISPDFSGNGGQGGGPRPVATAAPEPEPNNNTEAPIPQAAPAARGSGIDGNESVMSEIKRRLNSKTGRRIGYGGAAAGGLAAITAALTNSGEQEREVEEAYYR